MSSAETGGKKGGDNPHHAWGDGGMRERQGANPQRPIDAFSKPTGQLRFPGQPGAVPGSQPLGTPREATADTPTQGNGEQGQGERSSTPPIVRGIDIIDAVHRLIQQDGDGPAASGQAGEAASGGGSPIHGERHDDTPAGPKYTDFVPGGNPAGNAETDGHGTGGKEDRHDGDGESDGDEILSGTVLDGKYPKGEAGRDDDHGTAYDETDSTNREFDDAGEEPGGAEATEAKEVNETGETGERRRGRVTEGFAKVERVTRTGVRGAKIAAAATGGAAFRTGDHIAERVVARQIPHHEEVRDGAKDRRDTVADRVNRERAITPVKKVLFGGGAATATTTMALYPATAREVGGGLLTYGAIRLIMAFSRPKNRERLVEPMKHARQGAKSLLTGGVIELAQTQTTLPVTEVKDLLWAATAAGGGTALKGVQELFDQRVLHPARNHAVKKHTKRYTAHEKAMGKPDDPTSTGELQKRQRRIEAQITQAKISGINTRRVPGWERDLRSVQRQIDRRLPLNELEAKLHAKQEELRQIKEANRIRTVAGNTTAIVDTRELQREVSSLDKRVTWRKTHKRK